MRSQMCGKWGMRVEMVRHDEAAERAALKIAAARFGGAVSLTGSGEFRER